MLRDSKKHYTEEKKEILKRRHEERKKKDRMAAKSLKNSTEADMDMMETSKFDDGRFNILIEGKVNDIALDDSRADLNVMPKTTFCYSFKSLSNI